MTGFLLLWRIALRNIFSSFLNVVIGLIVLAGTLFLVVGGSLVSSVDKSMSQSIIGSVVGHAQVYNAASKDAPAVFDSWNEPDLEAIPDFSKIKAPLLSNPNVRSVVPMGVGSAIVAYGNTVDQALEKLRSAETSKPKAPKEEIESLKAHVRQIIAVIKGDYAKFSVVAAQSSVDAQSLQDLDKAASPAFWAGFDADPLGHLEFLENRIASLVPDSDQIFFNYVGTDLDAFSSAFNRMEVVDGQKVPKGRRGIMLSKYVYEEQFKVKIAHRLDQIKEAVDEKEKKIATDPDLKDLIKQNRTQTREIILQLDPLSTAKATAILQGALHSKEADLGKLFSTFLDTDDSNFHARYDLFYKQIAPLIELYRIKPGDELTIKAYSKSGFQQAVNAKVWGTFTFKGLEKSGLAGGLSLMDLMSFRDLYGYVTPEKIAETKKLEQSAGAQFVERDKAESELFGGGSLVGESSQKTINDTAELGPKKRASADLTQQTYTQDQIEKGVVIEAALILKDPSKLKQTLKEVQALSDSQHLGLKVVDWQKAAGNLGQFVFVAELVLAIAAAIIFIVALVVINNAVVMATLQRVREIGTLRAIGAQRGFVLAMVLMETMVLGLAFGAIGMAGGSALVGWMARTGLPARNEFLYFFFSGPRLHPTLNVGSLVGAFVVVLAVTCVSALYPALVASRVEPVLAMASED
jgi:ABC-type lipoprotein release transport system permease subunit